MLRPHQVGEFYHNHSSAQTSNSPFADEGRYRFNQDNRFATGVAFPTSIGLTAFERRNAEENVRLLSDQEILEIADTETSGG